LGVNGYHEWLYVLVRLYDEPSKSFTSAAIIFSRILPFFLIDFLQDNPNHQDPTSSWKAPTNQLMDFNTLPSLIALAILVVVFRAILRQSTSERLHLWLTGWILGSQVRAKSLTAKESHS